MHFSRQILTMMAALLAAALVLGAAPTAMEGGTGTAEQQAGTAEQQAGTAEQQAGTAEQQAGTASSEGGAIEDGMDAPSPAADGGTRTRLNTAVLFDMGDGRYTWSDQLMYPGETAWNATVQAAGKLGLELDYSASEYGILLDSINGVEPPGDFSVYWRFLKFNGSSGAWEMSMEGSDSVVVNQNDAYAWHYSAWTGAMPAPLPDHRYPVTDFRGGPYHRGWSGAEPVTYPQIEWFVNLGHGPMDATPITVGERVYVYTNGETDWETMEVTSQPTVFCLDWTTGAEMWRTEIEGNSWQASTPAYYDGTLYVGSTSGDLYAIQASDGTILWNYTTNQSYNGITSSPVVGPDGVSMSGKAVYFGAGSGEVYSLALNGSYRWSAEVGEAVYFSSPLVYDDRIFIGDDGGKLNCLKASDGTVLWNVTTGEKVRCSPALADGRVAFTSKDGKLRAVDTDGAPAYTVDVGDSVSSPAVGPYGSDPLMLDSNGLMYAASDGGLQCLDLGSSGEAVWSATLNGPIHASPVVCGDVVYTQTNVNDGENASTIYAHNAEDGTPMFLIPISPAEWSLSSVAVTDGRFFAASDNGFIYCFAQGEPPADGEDGGDGGEDGGDPQDGGDEEPPALYMRAEAVGPVHFMLTDADGKSAGFNGDGQLMLEIPGSTVTGPDDRVNTAPAATRTDGRLHKAPGTYTRTDGEGEDRPLTVVVVPMDAYDIHLKAYEDGMYDLTLYYYPEGSEPVEFFQGTDVDIAEGEEHIYRAVEGDPDEGGDGSSTEDGEDGETPDGGANGVDGGTDGADGGDGGTGTDGDDDGGVTLEMDRDGDGVPDEEVKLGDTFTGGDIGAPTLPPDGDGGDGGDSGSGKEEDDGDGWLPGLTSALFIAAVISALALFAVRRRR